MTLHLVLGLPDTIIGWRHPASEIERLGRLDYLVEVAQQAEAAGVDAVFRADSPYLARTHRAGPWPGLEPFTLAAALTAQTDRLGVIATASTTWNEPYSLARTVATLSQLSGHRVAWNAVTSAVGEANYGAALPAQPERYERAGEFIEVTRALWDSWQPGSILGDRAGGRYSDLERIVSTDHSGKHFTVAGPLDVRGTAGEQPIIVQAGGTGTGRDLGAAHADIIYTVSPDLHEGVDFAADIRRRAWRLGRAVPGPLLFEGVLLVIGSTTAEAQALDAELRAEIDLVAGRQALTGALGGVDLDGLDLDDVIPRERLDIDVAALRRRQSRPQLFIDLARRGATLRQLIESHTLSGGVLRLIGNPAEIADALGQWHVQGAADGFVVFPSHLPHGRDLFLHEVIPELRRRDLVTTGQHHHSLRQRFAPYGAPRQRRASVQGVSS